MADTATRLRLTGKGKPYKKDMARAVRKHCYECMGGSWSEIERCLSPKCSLFPFRLGPDRVEVASVIPIEAAPHVSPGEIGGGYFADEGQV